MCLHSAQDPTCKVVACEVDAAAGGGGGGGRGGGDVDAARLLLVSLCIALYVKCPYYVVLYMQGVLI